MYPLVLCLLVLPWVIVISMILSTIMVAVWLFGWQVALALFILIVVGLYSFGRLFK